MTSRVGHIAPLTSLRFIAAMMIFLVHTSGRLGMPNFKDVFAFGQGVSFFYVLSGFILTYVYVGSGEPLRLKSFFRSRIARLYPLHIVTFIAAILLVPNVRDTLVQRIPEIPLQLTMTQSWLGTYKAGLGFNGPAWSISTEFGFYLLFPLFLKFYNRIYTIFFAAIVLTGLVIIAAIHTEGAFQNWLWQALHVHPLGRLVEFIAGICAARVLLSGSISFSKRASTVLEILFLLTIIFIGSFNKEIFIALAEFENGPQLGAYLNRSGLFMLFAVLVWVFAHAKGAISQILSYSFMIVLGKISFAFYLIHQIVILFFEQNHDLLLGHDPMIIFFILLLLSLGFSYPAYKLIERPFQSLLRGKSDAKNFAGGNAKRMVQPAAIAILTVLAGYITSMLSPGFKGISSQEITQFQSQAIEVNIISVNADFALTHYKYEKLEDEICYEMLWQFGQRKVDYPIRRIVNIPHQARRKTVGNKIIISPRAWEDSNKDSKHILDKFCFPAAYDNTENRKRLLTRIMVRQDMGTEFLPIEFKGENGAQNILLLDYRDPGPFIWLRQ